MRACCGEKDTEIRKFAKVKWAPGAQNASLDDLIETLDQQSPDQRHVPDIDEATVPMARAANTRPNSQGSRRSQPSPRGGWERCEGVSWNVTMRF